MEPGAARHAGSRLAAARRARSETAASLWERSDFELHHAIRGSAMVRTPLSRLRRNLAVVLGNGGDETALEVLERAGPAVSERRIERGDTRRPAPRGVGAASRCRRAAVAAPRRGRHPAESRPARPRATGADQRPDLCVRCQYAVRRTVLVAGAAGVDAAARRSQLHPDGRVAGGIQRARCLRPDRQSADDRTGVRRDQARAADGHSRRTCTSISAGRSNRIAPGC